MSNNLEVSAATVDDWLGILACAERLSKSRFSAYVSATPSELEGFLINSRMHPGNVGFLLLKWEGTVVGLCALLAIDAPRPGTIGVYTQIVKHCFIHSVYIDPFLGYALQRRNVPSQAGKVFYEAIENWGRQRGACYIYGNVREDGHFEGFFKKFGLKVQHRVVGKEITNG